MENSIFQTLVLEQLQDVKQDIRDIKQDVRDLRTDLKSLEHKVDEGFTSVRSDMKDDRKKLEEVHQARNFVKIKFGWEWGMISFVIAIFAAGVTQVFD
jgi:hypothetical protein